MCSRRGTPAPATGGDDAARQVDVGRFERLAPRRPIAVQDADEIDDRVLAGDQPRERRVVGHVRLHDSTVGSRIRRLPTSRRRVGIVTRAAVGGERRARWPPTKPLPPMTRMFWCRMAFPVDFYAADLRARPAHGSSHGV